MRLVPSHVRVGPVHYFDALRERCAAGDLASLRVLLDTWDTLTPPQTSP
jgi:hypothetical protein